MVNLWSGTVEPVCGSLKWKGGPLHTPHWEGTGQKPMAGSLYFRKAAEQDEMKEVTMLKKQKFKIKMSIFCHTPVEDGSWGEEAEKQCLHSIVVMHCGTPDIFQKHSFCKWLTWSYSQMMNFIIYSLQLLPSMNSDDPCVLFEKPIPY